MFPILKITSFSETQAAAGTPDSFPGSAAGERHSSFKMNTETSHPNTKYPNTKNYSRRLLLGGRDYYCLYVHAYHLHGVCGYMYVYIHMTWICIYIYDVQVCIYMYMYISFICIYVQCFTYNIYIYIICIYIVCIYKCIIYM